MNLVAYLRVSTTEQAKEGVSLAAQESRIRSWALGMEHTIVAIHTDDGVSGSVPPEDRDGYRDCLRDLRAGKAEGLVTTASDRLSRDVRNSLDLAEQFTRNGWALCSMRESLDTSTAMARMMFTIRAAISQYEREITGERTSEALAEVKGRDRLYCRFVPWGKALGPKVRSDRNGAERWVYTLIPCEDEIQVAATIAHLRGEGKNSAQIAAHLNTAIHHPRSRQPWTARTVQGICRLMVKNGATRLRKAPSR